MEAQYNELLQYTNFLKFVMTISGIILIICNIYLSRFLPSKKTLKELEKIRKNKKLTDRKIIKEVYNDYIKRNQIEQ